MSNFPQLGYGLGLRAQHLPYIFEHRPAVDWFEIISENYMQTQGNPLRNISRLRQDYPLVMHGVALSIGTVDAIHSDYLKKLAILIDYLQPAWVSDHLCWTGVAHQNTHDLLPIPYTQQALAHIIQRIHQVQDYLGRPIALENPSTYLQFQQAEMHEADFINQMQKATDCYLLLDVNNIYVSCFNHGLDAYQYIDKIALDKVIQIHLAGHRHCGTHIIDTHDSAVCDEVWALYQYVIQRAGRIPNSMLEWDDEIPPFETLLSHLQVAKSKAQQALNMAPLGGQAAAQATATAAVHSQLAPASADKASHGKSLADSQITMQQQIMQADLPTEQQLTEWIKAKAQMTAQQQLAVYREAYRYRLFDAVAEDFPVLQAYLTEAVFEQLLHQLIEQVPPHHFNIARYSDELLPYLSQAMPQDGFAHEICQLELAILHIADLPDSLPLQQQHIQHLQPEHLLQAVLNPRHALRLMQFHYPVNEFYQKTMQASGKSTKRLRRSTQYHPQDSYLVVYQDDGKVWRLEIDQQEYALLKEIFSGKTVAQALEPWLENVPSDLQGYFARWMQHQLFVAPLQMVAAE